MQPVAVVLIAALLGVGLIVASVAMLAGLPWAMLAAGAALVGFAVILRRGLSSDGG